MRKFVVFGGRAPRSEFWHFHLFCALVLIAALMVGIDEAPEHPSGLTGGYLAMALVLLFLVLLLPMLAVTVRRLHDIDRTGWWYLISFVPFGGVVLFIFAVIQGTRGANRFGPDPFEDRYVADVFN